MWLCYIANISILLSLNKKRKKGEKKTIYNSENMEAIQVTPSTDERFKK